MFARLRVRSDRGQPGPGPRRHVVRSDFDLRSFVAGVERFGYLFGPPVKSQRRAPRAICVWRMGVCAAVAMNSMISRSRSTRVWLRARSFACSPPQLRSGRRRRSRWRAGLLSLGLEPCATGSPPRPADRARHRPRLRRLGPLVLRPEARAAYFDTLDIFIALMLLGRWLQERVVERNRAWLLASDGTEGLLARRVRDGRVELVGARELAGGDELLVAARRPGRRGRSPHRAAPASFPSTGSSARAGRACIAPGDIVPPARSPAGKRLHASGRPPFARVAAARAAADARARATTRAGMRPGGSGSRASMSARFSRSPPPASWHGGSAHRRPRPRAASHDRGAHRDVPVRLRHRRPAGLRDGAGGAAPARAVRPVARASLDRARAVTPCRLRQDGNPDDGALAARRPGRPGCARRRRSARRSTISSARSGHPKSAAVREALEPTRPDARCSRARVDELPGAGSSLSARQALAAGRAGLGRRPASPGAAPPDDVAFGVDGRLLALLDDASAAPRRRARGGSARPRRLRGVAPERRHPGAGRAAAARQRHAARAVPSGDADARTTRRASSTASTATTRCSSATASTTRSPSTTRTCRARPPWTGPSCRRAPTSSSSRRGSRRSVSPCAALARSRKSCAPISPSRCVYNTIAVGLALAGRMSPLACAVLMPLSSLTTIARDGRRAVAEERLWKS